MSKNQGYAIESLFITQSLFRGWDVLLPFGDNSSYDCVIYTGNRFIKVQIKSCTSMYKGIKYHINTGRGAKAKKNYTRSDIDILAVFIEPESVWYILPVTAIEDKLTINLYPHEDGKGLYEVCKEAWHLIDEATQK